MADSRVPNFLRRDKDTLFFNQDGELIFYVPEIYFDRGDALISGEFVSILGIFDYAVFDKNGKNGGLKRFFFPNVFITKPYAIDKQKNVKLKANQPTKDYRLLRYKKDDAVVLSTRVPEDSANIESFYKIALYGKLPNTIPYDKLQDYFLENITLNGASYGVTAQMFGFIIGELCRSNTDLNKAFRHTKFKDPTDYKILSIVDLPKYISPHQSLVSQNWDNAVVGLIMNQNQVDSPLEKLLMGDPEEQG